MLKSLLAVCAVLVSTATASYAQDKLKVAIPQRGFWDSTWVEFGQAAGFFKEAGLEVEIFWTDGGAQTLTAAMSGSVDVALSNGFLGVIGAHFKGAPIKVIAAEMTGANELFWYVRADSPAKTLADVPAGKTVAFSSPGSSSHLILLGLLRDANSKAKPLATGGTPGTYTQVMSGQVDVGWGAPPFVLADVEAGKARIIARSAELKEMQNQTIRVNVANVESLKTKRAAIERFMRVIEKSIDWAYSNPKAIEMYAANTKVSVDIAKKAVDEFFPKSAMQIGEIRGLEKSLKDALDAKFIPTAKTPQDVESLFDIVYKPKAGG